jgi:hypothetical protein
VNYNGVPIPKPETRPDLAKPVLYWAPVIASGNLMSLPQRTDLPAVEWQRLHQRPGERDAQPRASPVAGNRSTDRVVFPFMTR